MEPPPSGVTDRNAFSRPLALFAEYPSFRMWVHLSSSRIDQNPVLTTTLFIKKIGKDLFVLQIYVDDIIFGSTNQDSCEEFKKMMANEFEMSMIA